MAAGEGTRREGVSAGFVEGGTRREGASSGWRANLPPELSREFSIVRELGSGAEGFVLLVADQHDQRFVVKLYFPNLPFDPFALALLESALPEHVVRVVRSGEVATDGSRFEVLEWCEPGSLRDVMARRDSLSVVDVVAELGGALEHFHSLRVRDDPARYPVHQDVKPENVFVRSLDPLDLVLGDFGLVRTLDASVLWTRSRGTPLYAPPEFEGGEVSPAWDWWSLGMIVAELAGERHPFALPDGTMLSDQQIRASLAQRPVDLSAVRDQRVVLLCRGLLTRDRHHRWGAGEVRDWLGGGSPSVVSDQPSDAGVRTRRVLFAGVEHSTPTELAATLQQHWVEAFRRLFQERDSSLVDELERMLRQHHLDEAVHLLAIGSASAAELPRRFAALLAEMDPQLDPVYDGITVTPQGLEATGLEVIRAGGNHPTARVLDEVRRQNILTVWRALPDMPGGPAIHEAWVGSNQELETAVSSLKPSGFEPSPADWALARAWLLVCALDPEHHSTQLAQLVRDLDRTDADPQQWWRNLRNTPTPTPAVLSLTLLTHPAAIQNTHRARESARQAQQTARREEEAERARRAAERQRIQRENALAGRRILVRVVGYLLWPALIFAGFSVFFTYGPPANNVKNQHGLPVFLGYTNKQALLSLLAVSSVGLILIFLGAALQVPRNRRSAYVQIKLAWGCALGVAAGVAIIVDGFGGSQVPGTNRLLQAKLAPFLWFPIAVGVGALLEGLIRRSLCEGG